MKKTHVVPAIILIILTASSWYYHTLKAPTIPIIQAPTISSFEDCVKAGYPVMETYPRQCKTLVGANFVEVITATISYKNATSNLITVDTPLPDALVTKNFTVSGKARGTWYFEATFPLSLVSNSGTVITTAIARANTDWMTEDFVPFTANFILKNSYTGPATLILRNDNSSGLPEKDASISFPIVIK